MPKFSRAQVHVDRALSNFSQRLALPGFIAAAVLPRIGVDKESDLYYRFHREELRDLGGRDLRPDAHRASSFHWEPRDTVAYALHERALETPVSDRVVRNADLPIRPMQRSVQKMAYSLLLQHEIRTQALLYDASVPTAGVGTVWSDPAADIEEDIKDTIETMRATLGVEPNTIIFPAAVAHKVVSYLKASAEISIGEKATLLNMPDEFLGLKVHVAKAVKNTADEEGAESLTAVWPGTTVWIGYVEQNPGLDSAGFGARLEAQPMTVSRWYEEPISSTILRLTWIHDEHLMTPEAGYVLTGVL